MTENEFTVVRSIGFLLAVAIAVTLQRLSPHSRLRGSWRTNVGLWAIDGGVLATVCGACAYAAAQWANAAEVGLLAAVPLPRMVSIVVTILVLDAVSYAWHRANHQVRWLWQFHKVHHSDTAFTVSTAVRFHPGELVLAVPVRLVAIVLLGAAAEGVLIFELIFALANLIEHGDINLPVQAERRLTNVLVSPALHRRHHSMRVAELNTNFGTIFSFWDRWLGTFLASDSTAEVTTGLVGMSRSLGLWEVVVLPVVNRSVEERG